MHKLGCVPGLCHFSYSFLLFKAWIQFGLTCSPFVSESNQPLTYQESLIILILGIGNHDLHTWKHIIMTAYVVVCSLTDKSYMFIE